MTTAVAVLGCSLAAGAAFLPLRLAAFSAVAVAGTLLWAGAAWLGGLDAVRPLVAVCVFLLALLGRRLSADRRRARSLLRVERAGRAAVAELGAARERERIARDLHDGLTHLLTSQLVVLRTAHAALTDGHTTEALRRLVSGIGLSEQTLREAHEVVAVLRGEPPRLQVLRDTVQEWACAHGHRAELVLPDREQPVLDGARWGALLATLREALTNVTRHSAAESVHVEVTMTSTELRLLVTDPGPARQDGPPRSGYGVVGLRERAELLHGSLHAGALGPGWRIKLTLPLPVPTVGPTAAALAVQPAAGDGGAR